MALGLGKFHQSSSKISIKHHSGRTNFWGGKETSITSLRHVSMYGTGSWQISSKQFLWGVNWHYSGCSENVFCFAENECNLEKSNFIVLIKSTSSIADRQTQSRVCHNIHWLLMYATLSAELLWFCHNAWWWQKIFGQKHVTYMRNKCTLEHSCGCIGMIAI